MSPAATLIAVANPFSMEGIMRSHALSSGPWARRALAGIAVVVFHGAAPAHAQVACTLLQPAEMEAALKEWAPSGKAAKFAPATDTAGGMTTDTCTAEIVRPNGHLVVTVVVVKNAPMDGGDAIRTRNAAMAREGQWKVSGAQFEQRTVGTAICTMYGRPSVAAHSVCAIPRGRGYVEVDVQSPTQKEMASMEAVGGLVQKASTRF